MISFGNKSIFGSSDEISIPDDTDVVFVADLFSSDHLGGAELTTDALIDSSPLRVFRLHSKDVTLDLLRDGHSKYWIFGNFASLDSELIPTIVANMKYSILEYDYKFCRYRSPEKHEVAEGSPCDCNNQMSGKLISAFYHGARSLWWMSEMQMAKYMDMFPFLEENNNTVLSSVFSEEFFATVKILREKYEERKGWIIVGSTSWIKGIEDAEKYCQDKGLEYEVVWKVSHDQLLDKLAQSEGLVFLPRGGDTCPRIVIEAKLLGCKLVTNDNVQHSKEIWFDTDDILDTESYLYMARERFWNGIKADMNYVPTISGYTTTKNCIEQGYPYIEAIQSMLGFCDEVVVVDGGSTDGTWEALESLVEFGDGRLRIHKEVRDWDHPRFAVFDGEQKAVARSLCTGDFCWQQDSDEVVHLHDFKKIKDLVRDFPNAIQLLSLPVIEYWGGPTKVRADIFPWKWRLSRNLPHITHGIPGQLRKYDEEGNLFAHPGTDGCDYIHTETLEPIPNSSFYTQDVDNVRKAAMFNTQALEEYEKWFKMMIKHLPSVHHYSWFDIGRKIRTYRDYWSKHWQSLYDITQDDTAENNMFFQRPWSDVTEDDINRLADRLSMEMGGWVFHDPVDFSRPTPHLTIDASHPPGMTEWMEKHRPLLDDESKDKIGTLLTELLEVKGNDNWQSVRKPEGNYEIVEREYPFGTRKTYSPIKKDDTYGKLQQSRGITINLGDDIETFLNRAVDSMDDLMESDRIRSREILDYLGSPPENFAELGFRIPRLQRYFQSLGSKKTVGFDVADISLRVGEALGYDVRFYDFNSLSGDLELTNSDLVVSYHMLEHLSDPLAAVQKIFDSMKPGAIFHVEIPIEPDGPRLRYAHLFPFHPGDIRSMLEIAGFEIKNVSTKVHTGGPQIERLIAMKSEDGS